MKTELQQLITEWQAEADLLQKELNKCLEDYDYKGAHKFQKCLGLVKSKLSVLTQLENPYAVNIKKLEGEIKRLKIHITDLKYRFPFAFDKDQEVRYQLKLNALEACKRELESKPLPFHVDSEVLYCTFESMAANDIQQFTLALERPNTHIFFSKQDSGLKIAISVVNNEDGILDLFRDKRNGLRGMGFTRTAEGPVLMLDNFDLDQIPRVIEILARLVYDVLGVAGGRKAWIIIKDRSGGN